MNKMIINIYLSTTESKKNKINKQAEQKLTRRYREYFDSCQMGGRLGGMGKKGKGIQNSHGDKVHHREYSQ